VDPAPCVVVRWVTQIPIGAERLFDTKTIDSFFLSASRMPIFFLSFYALALPHRDHNLLIVHPVSIETEKMKQQLSDALLIVLAKASYCVEIIGEARQGWLPSISVYLPVREFVERG
jgi:hypothetical protein